MANVYHGTVDQVGGGIQGERLEYGISLGRRAPIHCMHVDCILEIAEAGLKPVIFIGSVNGPESPLYDPVKNPLTVDQQKEQFRRALEDSGYDEAHVITLEDVPDDNEWMTNLVQKLKDNGLYGKAVVHLRTKAADALKMNEAIPPLSRYNQSFVDSGVSVWQSYNRDLSYDTINASDIRSWDLNKLTIPQRGIIAAPAHLISLARKARSENPDRELLEAHSIPLTILDLSFDRMWREAGIKTADVLKRAEEAGDLSVQSLAKAATAIVEQVRGPKMADVANDATLKPLLVLGPSVSPETAGILRRDGLFEVASASIGQYQNGSHFVELFWKNPDAVRKVKDAEVFVIQSTAEPVGDHMEHLLKMIHTPKYHGAKKVTAIIPFIDTREDRAFEHRSMSVGDDMYPRLFAAAGADKIICFGMHSQAAIDHYKSVFGDNFVALSTNDVFAQHIKERFPFTSSEIVSGAPDGANKPDDEGQKRARDFIVSLRGEFNEKARFKIGKAHTAESETKTVSFEGDVAGKVCVIIDDMIDGGSTMVNAAILLKQRGAKSVICCATHAVLTKGQNMTALERLMTAQAGDTYAIDGLMMTDSIPEAADKVEAFAKQYPDLAKKIDIIPLGPAVLAHVKKQLAVVAPANSLAPHPKRAAQGQVKK